ncbi:hypothetical protein BC834DRAFT_966782 [Gloeopeniophorella convolvens]|nr:hypothetical protein BC834DRAFT_966782 [Gloeopeniophorella convolvens]
MARAMITPLARLAGDMYAARDAATGALVGYTIWVRPGETLFATKEQRQLGFYELFEQLPEDARAYYLDALARDFPEFADGAIGVKDTEKNSYWCYFAMVREDYQGTGVARALFDLAYDKAQPGDILGLATTNPRNIEIYTRLGLELKGHRVMPSEWVDWGSWVFSRRVEGLRRLAVWVGVFQ